MLHERTKHIDVKYHYVNHIVAQGKLKACNISTYDNHADMMTYSVLVAKFELCSRCITVLPKWLLARTSVFFVVEVIFEVHTTIRIFSQGEVFYIMIQIHKKVNSDERSKDHHRCPSCDQSNIAKSWYLLLLGIRS
jgi:hypothetical protein